MELTRSIKMLCWFVFIKKANISELVSMTITNPSLFSMCFISNLLTPPYTDTQ